MRPRVARRRHVAAHGSVGGHPGVGRGDRAVTQLPSLPISTFSMAGTSELNIVVVLSLPTFPSQAIAWAFV